MFLISCQCIHIVVLLKLSHFCQSLSYLSFKSWGKRCHVMFQLPFFYFSFKSITWCSRNTKRRVKVVIKLDRNTNSHSVFNTTCKKKFAVSISFLKAYLLSWLSPHKSFSLSPNLKYSIDFSFTTWSEFCNWLLKKVAHIFIDSSENPSRDIPRFAGTVCMSRRNVERLSLSTCLYTTICKRHLHTLSMPPG